MPFARSGTSAFVMALPAWVKRSRPDATLSGKPWNRSLLAGDLASSRTRRSMQHSPSHRVLFFTPDVRANFGALRHQLDNLLGRINVCIDQHTGKTTRTLPWEYVELVVLDEAERLNQVALEYLRDLFDRNDIGLILIGMPGIEKRMSRYPQLFSRVGFAHHYRPLLGDELSFVLTRHWQRLGLQLDGADFTDAQAIASIARITGGNFRLLRRLFLQIERVLQVNELTVITDDVVNAARSNLVIGVT